MTLGQKLVALKEKLLLRYYRQFHYQTAPFGPAFQKYWDRRYFLFTKFDQGIETDTEGLHSVTPEKTAQEIAELVATPEVIDAFCGIGGNAIAFAAGCQRVYAFDLNSHRLEMAQHNAQVYHRHNITFIEDDFRNHSEIAAGTVFLDPPWGGMDYRDKNPFTLADFIPTGDELLQYCLARFKRTIFRVPFNFDLEELKQLDRPYKIKNHFMEGRLISRSIIFDA